MMETPENRSDNRTASSLGRILFIAGMAIAGAALFGVIAWFVSVLPNDSSQGGDDFALFNVVW